MSNLSDFNSKLEAIQAVPEKDVKQANMPVGIFIQEGEDLLAWSATDREILVSKGLQWQKVEDLRPCLGALREAQSRWSAERNAQEEASKIWKMKAPDAYDLRDTLVHDFLYAFRNDGDILTKVRLIAEGSTHADMIQDLNDLSVLGLANPEPLAAISADPGRLETAASLAAELSELLAIVNGDRAEHNELKTIRDKAYTLCKEYMDEIRACGQYAFWRDAERVKGYASTYRHKQNKRIKADNEPVANQ